MPPSPTFLVSLLTALVLTTLLGMLVAWFWALQQLAAGRPLLPPGRPAAVPWGGWSVLALLATYLVIHLLTIQGYLLVSHRPPAAPFSFREQMILTALINGSLLVVLPLTLRALSGAKASDLGLSGDRLGRQVATGAVAFLLVALPVNLVNVLATKVWQPHHHPLELMIREEGPGASSLGRLAFLAFLTAVVLAPAAEELIFRGIIQNWLERVFAPRSEDIDLLPSETGTRDVGWEPPDPHTSPPNPLQGLEQQRLTPPDSINPYEAPHTDFIDQPRDIRDSGSPPRRANFFPVLITSTVFAAVHAPQWPAPVAIFFLSVALGVVYQRTRSLVSSFILHALFNGLSTLILFLALLGGQVPAKKAVPPEAYVSVRPGTAAAPAPPVLPLGKSDIEMFFSVGAGGPD